MIHTVHVLLFLQTKSWHVDLHTKLRFFRCQDVFDTMMEVYSS